MGISIVRHYTFSAAHRIEGHPKCGRLHGHNYRVMVELITKNDPLPGGMVMDFGDLDNLVRPIVERLDHHYIISKDNILENDPFALVCMTQREEDGVIPEINYSTAEELAIWFYTEIQKTLDQVAPNVFLVTGITVEETDKSRAVCHAG